MLLFIKKKSMHLARHKGKRKGKIVCLHLLRYSSHSDYMIIAYFKNARFPEGLSFIRPASIAGRGKGLL